MTNSLVPIILASVSLVVALFSFYTQSLLRDDLRLLEQGAGDSGKQVVLVDFQDLYNAYRAQSGEVAQFKKKLEKIRQGVAEQRNKLGPLVAELQKLEQALKDKKLSGNDLEKARKDIPKLRKMIQNASAQINREAARVQAGVNQEALAISKRIFAVLQREIRRKAEEKGYRYVLNAQAEDRTQIPVFLYSLETSNLTGELMKDMGLRPESLGASAGPVPVIPEPAAKEEAAKTSPEKSS